MLRIVSIPLLLAALWLVQTPVGDAAPQNRPPADHLWKWHERYVAIEPQATPNAPPNDHPVNFTAEQIGMMLDALSVVLPQKKRFFTRKKEDPAGGEPVFADNELEVLSDSLSRGLAKAGPREDIVFVTTGNYGVAFGGVLKERQVNTGRAFYKDGKLNIIFGAIRGKFMEDRGAGSMVAIPAVNPVPGTRQATVPHEWNLVLGPGVNLYENQRGSRTDWVQIEPAAAVARFEEKQKLEALSGKEGLSPLAEETERLAAEQEELSRKIRQLEEDVKSGKTPAAETPAPAAVKTPAPAAIKTPVPAAAAVEPAPAEGSLEQRLRTLKRLRDEGLTLDP
jgi:hypothetical protein